MDNRLKSRAHDIRIVNDAQTNANNHCGYKIAPKTKTNESLCPDFLKYLKTQWQRLSWMKKATTNQTISTIQLIKEGH
jgi:hypothetical protein